MIISVRVIIKLVKRFFIMFDMSLEEVRRDKSNIPAMSPYQYLESLDKDSIYNYDFKLIYILTKCEKESDGTISYFNINELTKFNNDDFFVNEFDKISQIYYIRPILRDKSYVKGFQWSIELNESATLLKAYLFFDERRSYSKELYEEVFEEFCKALIKKKILIGIRRNSKFRPQLKEFLENLSKEDSPLEMKFFVYKGVELVDSIPDRVELCTKAGDSLEDYNYLVNKDDLLCRYYPAILGKKGRDLYGKIIPLSVIDFKANEISCGENIYITKEGNTISFYAKEYGYFVLVNKECRVINSILQQTISVKSAGNLKTDINERVSLKIMNFDELEDGIQAGMTLEVKNINISGNVDAATLIGDEINVNGQTHSRSKIIASKSYIKTHKGYVKGEKICVSMLDGGKIVGDVVFVHQSLGGIIIANKVYVKELCSDTNIYASECVVVDKVVGNSNQFIFERNAFLKDIFNKNTNKEENISDRIKKDLHDTTRKLKNICSVIIKNQSRAIKIRQEIENDINKTGYTEFMMQFERYKHNYTFALEEYHKLSRLKYLIDYKKYLISDKILRAKVIIREGNFGNDNLILYRLQQPKEQECREVLSKQTIGKPIKAYLEIKNFQGEILEEYHLSRTKKFVEDEKEANIVEIDLLVKNSYESGDLSWVASEKEKLRAFLQTYSRNNVSEGKDW